MKFFYYILFLFSITVHATQEMTKSRFLNASTFYRSKNFSKAKSLLYSNLQDGKIKEEYFAKSLQLLSLIYQKQKKYAEALMLLDRYDRYYYEQNSVDFPLIPKDDLYYLRGTLSKNLFFNEKNPEEKERHKNIALSYFQRAIDLNNNHQSTLLATSFINSYGGKQLLAPVKPKPVVVLPPSQESPVSLKENIESNDDEFSDFDDFDEAFSNEGESQSVSVIPTIARKNLEISLAYHLWQEEVILTRDLNQAEYELLVESKGYALGAKYRFHLSPSFDWFIDGHFLYGSSSIDSNSSIVYQQSHLSTTTLYVGAGLSYHLFDSNNILINAGIGPIYRSTDWQGVTSSTSTYSIESQSAVSVMIPIEVQYNRNQLGFALGVNPSFLAKTIIGSFKVIYRF